MFTQNVLNQNQETININGELIKVNLFITDKGLFNESGEILSVYEPSLNDLTIIIDQKTSEYIATEELKKQVIQELKNNNFLEYKNKKIQIYKYTDIQK